MRVALSNCAHIRCDFMGELDTLETLLQGLRAFLGIGEVLLRTVMFDLSFLWCTNVSK